MRDAAHVFWVMEAYGHKDLVVLEGGMNNWQKMGNQITTDKHTFPTSKYIPMIDPTSLATKLSTRLGVNQ